MFEAVWQQVARLIQKTYKELKRLEEEENVPVGSRSCESRCTRPQPPGGHTACSIEASKLRTLQCDFSSRYCNAGSLPRHFSGDASKGRPPGPERRPKSNLQDPAKAAKGKPKEAAPKQPVQGGVTKTAVRRPVPAAATEASLNPGVQPVAKTAGSVAGTALEHGHCFV